MKYVIDTSVLVDGRISKMVERGEIEGEIIVPEAAISELEAQANFGRISGFKGLEEVKRLNELSKSGAYNVKLRFAGERPRIEHIKLARGGEIDELIRKIAYEENATLITSDRVQYEVAIAKNIYSKYLEKERISPEKTKIMSFFDYDVSSVHLREGVPPVVKRGKIGELRVERVSDEPMSADELREIACEIIEAARQDEDSSVEMDRGGATVVQLRDVRIAIADRPFADRMEITAVRPVAKVTLDEYGLSIALKRRIVERQRGILIAGPPGAGKSTFAASVADYLITRGFIVKTMESPRDLMVRDEITQYAPLDGNMALTADILLLVRPDYTIYDEMRKTADFQVFADMRLAGVGMIGVVHATRPIDAIQRMIGRVELGIIPQVVDTVIFIDAGAVKKVLTLEFTVKVPHGMFEADLARPVIEVRDFERKSTEYEIYTYGEQVVVMPVTAPRSREKKNLDALKEHIREKLNVSACDIEIRGNTAFIFVPEDEIPFVIGRKGRKIGKIERDVGLNIEIIPLKKRIRKKKRKRKAEEEDELESEFSSDGISYSSYSSDETSYISDGTSSDADEDKAFDSTSHAAHAEELIEVEVEDHGKFYVLHIPGVRSRNVRVYADGDYLFPVFVSRNGTVRVRKEREFGKLLKNSLEEGKRLFVKWVK